MKASCGKCRGNNEKPTTTTDYLKENIEEIKTCILTLLELINVNLTLYIQFGTNYGVSGYHSGF